MARESRDSVRTAESGGQSRRGFLQTLGLLGGALAASSLASAAPVGLSQERPVIAHQLRRSSTNLRLAGAIRLQQTEAAGPAISLQLPTAPTLGEPPLPSTRQRALQSIFSASGSTLNPADFRLERATDGTFAASQPLTSVMQLDLLAQAYAEGITLTPSGCESVPSVNLSGPPPMVYASTQSWVTPDLFGQRLCLTTVDHPFPGAFFSALFNTPGDAQTTLTYVLELSMEPFDQRFESFLTSNPAGAGFKSAMVEFVPTNDGTQMALVQIRGSGATDHYAHGLHFRRGGASVAMTYFNWLNIIAL